MKKNNKKGFTLAELLIVVAIIAVLVAVAIPVFTTQLAKSELATATANVRGKYAEVVAEALAEGNLGAGGKLALGDDAWGSVQGAAEGKCTVTSTTSVITITHGKNTTLSNFFSIDDDIVWADAD